MTFKIVPSRSPSCHSLYYNPDDANAESGCNKSATYPSVLTPLTFEMLVNKYGSEQTIPQSEPIYQIKFASTETTCEVVVTFGHNIYRTRIFDPQVDVKLTITKTLNSELKFYHCNLITTTPERHTCTVVDVNK